MAAGCAGLALLTGAGLVARATSRGAETYLAAATHHLPGVLLTLLRIASGFALLLLPVALALRQLVRGHYRRLGEAIATSAVAVAVVVAANALVLLPGAADLYAVLSATRSGQVHTAPLDAYLRANIVALRPASAIAAEFGISERTLHRIFADRGTTFERHLLNLRVERFRSLLQQDNLRQSSIAALAMQCGFADAANGRVQTRAIATRGQNPDVFCHN